MIQLENILTLEEAKQYIAENFITGTQCPCCTQMVRQYSYKLYDSSAAALIRLYNLTLFKGDGEFHVKDYAEATEHYTRASHFAELRWWGLIEKMENPSKKAPSAGYWYITEKGKQFVRNEIKVKESIKMFNNQFHGFEGNEISISEALGTKFDYNQIFQQRNF